MDKTELESLLVKLKLGTITLDDAIEELQSTYFRDSDQPIKFFLPNAFSNVIYAHKSSPEGIKNQIDRYIDMKKDFICVGLDIDKISYLESSIKNITVDRDASIIYSIKDKLPKLNKNVAVIASAFSSNNLAKECMKLLELMGFEYECLTDISFQDIRKVINYLPDVDAVILIPSGDLGFISTIAEYSSKPIIVINEDITCSIPKLMSAASAGILYADNTSSFSAVVAVYRILGYDK